MTTQDNALYLNTSATASHHLQVKVHPVVVFSILDHFVRRNNENDSRVIGTLLGSNIDGIVEIKNCFPVPLVEGGQVGVDMEFHHTMLDLFQRATPKEMIVGWYATGGQVNEDSALLHEYFWKELNHPLIHLTVDTNLTNYSMAIKAYTTTPVAFGEKSLGSQFLPVPVEISAFDSEKIGVDVLIKSKNNPNSALTELENLESSVNKLIELIDVVTDYVSKVQEGKIKADNKIGRFLAEAVVGLPKLDPPTMERLFNSNLQDLLMVVYLANLTRTQLSLAEKLQKVV